MLQSTLDTYESSEELALCSTNHSNKQDVVSSWNAANGGSSSNSSKTLILPTRLEPPTTTRWRPLARMAVIGLGLVLVTLVWTLSFRQTRNPFYHKERPIEIHSYDDLLGIHCQTIDQPYSMLPEFDASLDPWMYSKCICKDGVVTEIDPSIPEHLWDNIGDAIDNPPLIMEPDQQFYCISRNVTGYENFGS